MYRNTAAGTRPQTFTAAAALTIFLLFATSGCATPARVGEDRAPISEQLHSRLSGVWYVERVAVVADDGVTPLRVDERTPLLSAWNRADRTNALLRERDLTILHRLRPDGTYTRTLDWHDASESRVVESGIWSIDTSHVLRCINHSGARAALPEAQVVYLDDSTLILRIDLAGAAPGKARVERLRREPPTRRAVGRLLTASAAPITRP